MNWITCTVATRAKDNRQRDSMPKDQTIKSHTAKTKVRDERKSRREEKKRKEKRKQKGKQEMEGKGMGPYTTTGTVLVVCDKSTVQYSTAQQHSIRAQSRETDQNRADWK